MLHWWWIRRVVGILGVFATFGSGKIWILRHCDKPLHSDSPCCSSYGYLRAESWGKYLSERVGGGREMFFMASDFRREDECLSPDLILAGGSGGMEYGSGILGASSCPKSQRMWITARWIQHWMTGTGPQLGGLGSKHELEVDTRFCVGQERDLAEFLRLRWRGGGGSGDVLVVWEHQGIIDILGAFGFPISKWRHRWKERYDLVFWVDLDMGRWGYDCYDFERGVDDCDGGVRGWLGAGSGGGAVIESEPSPEDLGAFFVMSAVFIFSGLVFSCGMVVWLWIDTLAEGGFGDFGGGTGWERDGIYRRMPFYGT